MNPLERARDGAGRAWFTTKRGTTRTAGWVKDGVTGAFGKARSGVSGLRASAEEPASKPAGDTADGALGIWERIGGANLVERARGDQRVAIVWAIAGIVVLAWIGWTIYVWTQNGAAAGIGVLITWPAVFLGAAIVASPFVGAGVLVRRHRLAADGAPPIAGGGGTATETKADQAPAKADGAENDEKSEQPAAEKEKDTDAAEEIADDEGSDDDSEDDEDSGSNEDED